MKRVKYTEKAHNQLMGWTKKKFMKGRNLYIDFETTEGTQTFEFDIDKFDDIEYKKAISDDVSKHILSQLHKHIQNTINLHIRTYKSVYLKSNNSSIREKAKKNLKKIEKEINDRYIYESYYNLSDELINKMSNEFFLEDIETGKRLSKYESEQYFVKYPLPLIEESAFIYKDDVTVIKHDTIT